MSAQPHFEEFLRLLEANKVDYMIVGGYAVAFHGSPRFTGDIDIFYDATDANIELLCKALTGFGFPEHEIPRQVFHTPGEMLTFGIPPIRVDLMNHIDGVAFKDAKPNLVRGRYGKTDVNFIGLDDLLSNKRSANRAKDKADIEGLT